MLIIYKIVIIIVVYFDKYRYTVIDLFLVFNEEQFRIKWNVLYYISKFLFLSNNLKIEFSLRLIEYSIIEKNILEQSLIFYFWNKMIYKTKLYGIIDIILPHFGKIEIRPQNRKNKNLA